MNKINKVRNKILKALKKTKRQFFDMEGNKITPEQYLDLLLKQKVDDMTKFLNNLKRHKVKP